jgi:mannose-6-phosphate isomerase-like protein (cupin superfamily)
MNTKKFQIFRAAQASTLQDAHLMHVQPFDPIQRAGVDKLIDAGYHDGSETKVLFNIPGFSLIHVWFKNDYPLLRHSHDSDCLYYIVAGSVKFGKEELGAGDGLFIPAGTPYTYRPGPNGVELLEFRHATEFNFVNLTTGEEFYKKALETITVNVENWQRAAKPPLNT